MKTSLHKNVLEGLEKGRSPNPRNPFFFNFPLSDIDIIFLHNLLMTPSIHCIKTKNIQSGRELMHLMLDSLDHYQRIGCVSKTRQNELRGYNLNLYKFKKEGRDLTSILEQLLVQNLQIDFVWIEMTLELKAEMTDNYFQRLVEVLNQNQQIPVVVVEYEQNN